MPTNWPTSLDDGTSLPTKVDGDDITAAETNTQSNALKGVEASIGVPASPAAGSTNYKLFNHVHDGTQSESAALAVGSSFALKGIISPTQIIADQNNYTPTSFATSSVLRISTDASHNITGLIAGATGKIVLVINIGTFNIVLKNQSASSTAANRFAFSADITIIPGQGLILYYDLTLARWVNPGAGLTDHTLLSNVTADQHHTDVHARAKHTTAIRVQDEGGAFTDILDVNFVGAGVAATFASGVATVTIPGGSGSPGLVTDIQNVGLAAVAGAVSKYADAGHVHPHGGGKNANDHHNQIHDNSDHTDFNGRSRWFHADMMTGTGAAGTLATSGIRYRTLADAATDNLKIAFELPDNWVSGMDVTLVWTPSATVATSVVKYRVSTLYVATGGDATAALTATDYTMASATHTVNLIYKDILTIATGYAVGNLMQFQIARLGADVADTMNASNVLVLGVKFSYVGDQ